MDIELEWVRKLKKNPMYKVFRRRNRIVYEFVSIWLVNILQTIIRIDGVEIRLWLKDVTVQDNSKLMDDRWLPMTLLWGLVSPDEAGLEIGFIGELDNVEGASPDITIYMKLLNML